MKMKVKLGDGSVTTVDAWWHPQVEVGGIATGGAQTRPAGLWTSDDVVMSHLREVNKVREEDSLPVRDLSDPGEILRGIQYAEAPLEVYLRGESEEPWRDTGNLVREAPGGYGEDPL